MPIYKTTIRGEDKPRYVRADTPAQARAYLVTAEGISAEELADAIADGAEVEKATTPTEE